MKIAYRRMSGPIGFTQFEEGTRGLWLEKRNALVTTLEGRKHTVDYVNRMTKYSQLASPATFGPKTHDLLIVEFGSSNAVFYGKDLAETERMMNEHAGKIVFVNDDPDLPLFWKKLDAKVLKRCSVWMNATIPVSFGGQPESVRSYDAPFAALLPYREPQKTVRQAAVYIGRPNGRRAGAQAMVEAGVELYGRQKEWKGWDVEVKASPKQAERGAFYAGVGACVTVADSKHKKLGWRTGRAFHALHAGTATAVECDHPGLLGFPSFETGAELSALLDEWWKTPEARLAAIADARKYESNHDVARFLDTLRLHGL